ncbi:MAG TPA: HAMP domain-containing sensor histidine kinase [Candidatus Limnocylindrales bacterium]|nr:HAMP domain-containing sensor histidine kinase [Candidatus Limnocylindrales bacterium]
MTDPVKPVGPDDPVDPGASAGRRPRVRPPWWPDDEPWPPADAWRGGRGPWWGPAAHRHHAMPGHPWGGRRSRRGPWAGPLRGFGCLFGVGFVLVVVGILTAITTLVTLVGPYAAALGGFVLVALGVLAARSVRWTARGLDDLVDAVAQVEAGDYSVRVPEPRGPRPLRALVRGFNTMAARLEADERERRSLLADVSHELRTPLAIIQGNLEAIADGVHPADEAHLGVILDESRVLDRLIDDLRTVALAESGTLPLHREPTDIAVVLADVASAAQGSAADAGVSVALDAPDSLPLLDADPVRVREIVTNLVANGIRYTPRGGSVTIAAALEPGGGAVVVSVRDTGAGIAPDVLPHVFERFWKSPESRGSGLGLAIARALVEAHGGRTEASSTPGAGTTVTFTLPVD